MSTQIASGPASSPPTPGDKGNSTPPPPGGDAPVVLSADDLAAQAAADAAATYPFGSTSVPAERNAAMDYANYWRAEALKVLQPPGPGGAAPAGAAPGAAQTIQPTRPAPKLADFPTGDGQFDALKWSEKLTEWNTEQLDHRATVSEQRRTQQAAATTEQTTYNAKVAAFRSTVPDFDIVAQNPNLPVSDRMVKAIMSADLGPQVYYHLAKNPAEAARIYRLPADQQAAAIGKLEGKIEAGAIKFAAAAAPAARPGAPAAGAPAAGAAPRQQSRAPEPPNPNRAGGSSEVNLANCSLDDYLAQRLPHIARGGPRK